MTYATLLKLELKKIIRSYASWGILALLTLLSAILFKSMIGHYALQAQLALENGGRVYGVSSEVIKPFWGWCLLMMAIVTPILSLLFINLERHKKSFDLWITFRINGIELVFIKFIALTLLITIFVSVMTIIPLSLTLIVPIDLGLTLSGAITVLCSSLFILALSLCLSFSINNPALCLISTYGFVSFLSFLPLMAPAQQLKIYFSQLSFLNHAHGMINGRIYWLDLMFFFITVTALLSVCILFAQKTLYRTKAL